MSLPELSSRSTDNSPTEYIDNQDEREPFLSGTGDVQLEDHTRSVSQNGRQLGVISAISLILNRMIGSGIYATPNLILRASGSVGLFLMMWILGATITAAGMAVYVEFGTGLPHSGGEKNYLEYLFRKSRLLATFFFAVPCCLLGWTTGNCVIFGEYMLHAFGGEITQWNTRLVGWACLTSITLIHSFSLNWGLRIQTTLALVKLGTLLFLILCGFSVLFGIITIQNRPNNFSNVWDGTRKDANAFVSGLYSVIVCFEGYNSAHYALSETKDPVKTLLRAAPVAMTLVTFMYLLVNISYLSVVSKYDILNGGRVIAALFFGNIFGDIAEKIFSVVICVSTFGGVLAITFSQSRAIQSLGREGILPHSEKLAASSRFNTPIGALFWQWFVCTLWMMVPPPGDAFNFVLSLRTYAAALINTVITGGLIWLYLSPSEKQDWKPPFRAGLPVVIVFFLGNVFLSTAPLIPPSPEFTLYEHLPYWLHIAGVAILFFIAFLYWYIFTNVFPRLQGYSLQQVVITEEDGSLRTILKHIPYEQ